MKHGAARYNSKRPCRCAICREGWARHRRETPNRKPGPQRAYTDDEFIGALRSFVERAGGGHVTFTRASELHRAGEPSAHAIRRRFGTWQAAYRAAGLPYAPSTGSKGPGVTKYA